LTPSIAPHHTRHVSPRPHRLASQDKFPRNHEDIHPGGLTRCAPGRVADRSRKWQPAQVRRAVEARTSERAGLS
jgi:hypothetical protein